MPKIECKNLKKVYEGGVYALDGVSFTLDSGDFLTVIGASGGGKTTLLKCIAGLLPITAGELFIDGELCNLSPVQERRVGVVFQELTLYPNMTVFENVAFALKKQKLPFDEECRRTREILQKMDLWEIQSAMPRQISYGQKQKVALARALVKNPDIVLFDEPMSNIDESTRVQYREMIKQAKLNYPESTFIYITHSVEDALTMGNKTMILDNGKIIQLCESRTLCSFPSSLIAAEYVFGSVDLKEAVIKGGRLRGKDGEMELDSFMEASLPFAEYEGRHVQYAYNKHFCTVLCNGSAICGVLDEYSIPCRVTKDSLTVDNKDYDAFLISEGLLSFGSGTAVLKRQSICYEYIENAIELSGTVIYADSCYAVYKIGKRVISDYNRKNASVGDEITLYYPISSLQLLDENGNIMLACYVLTENRMKAKRSGLNRNKILIGGKSFTLAEDELESGSVDIAIDRDAFSVADKKRGVQVTVINEEYSKDFTLCYAYIKGYEGGDYFTARLSPEVRCFSEQKLYFSIDETKIRVLSEEIYPDG